MYFNFIAGLTRGLSVAPSGGGSNLRASMVEENARWLSAFNIQDAEGVRATYTADAILIPPGAPMAKGRDEIGKFWQVRMESGVRDHTFAMVDVYSDGKYAYQVATWTATLVKGEANERTPLSGSNIRVFERQIDGAWKVKAHVFVRD